MDTDKLADLLSQAVRRRRLVAAGMQTDVDKPSVAFDGLPQEEQDNWRTIAECAIELFGGAIVAEEVAHAALEQVLSWCEEAPQMTAVGGNTGVSYQRGKVIATRVMPEATVGISTYETTHDAQRSIIRMERSYRKYLEDTGGKPREPGREIEEKFGIPPEFGGLVGAWLDDDHAMVLRVGHGRIIEGIQLTPLNALQMRQNLDELIRRGKSEGKITEEHERQSRELPPMPPSEYDPDYAPKD
jgi:hypothetical protein